MNRFATFLRFAVIVIVAIACGTLARLIPSPYHELAAVSTTEVQEVSAPAETNEKLDKSKFRGVDVDANRLTLASNIS